MHLIAVGRLRDGPEVALFDRYNARLRPKMRLTEIPEARGAPVEVKRREGGALLAALPANAFVVALDLGGSTPTSEKLSDLLALQHEQVRPEQLSCRIKVESL